MATDTTSTIKIAIGACIGVFVGGLLLHGYERATEQARLEEAIRQREAGTPTQAQIEDVQRPLLIAKAEQLAAELRLQRTLAQSRDDAIAAAHATSQAAAEKERAWTRYYQRPKECDNPPSDQAFVECSNGRIKARRLFEQSYKPGN